MTSDKNINRDELEYENTERIIEATSDVRMLLQLAKNISERRPSLIKLADKAISKANYLKNYELLPMSEKPEDLSPINIREMWLEASRITGRVGPRTLQMVKNRGYLGAMLRQIEDIERIGSGNFVNLREHNALQYSAEYILLNHFEQLLSPEQKKKIQDVLTGAGLKI